MAPNFGSMKWFLPVAMLVIALATIFATSIRSGATEFGVHSCAAASDCRQLAAGHAPKLNELNARPAFTDVAMADLDDDTINKLNLCNGLCRVWTHRSTPPVFSINRESRSLALAFLASFAILQV